MAKDVYQIFYKVKMISCFLTNRLMLQVAVEHRGLNTTFFKAVQ